MKQGLITIMCSVDVLAMTMLIELWLIMRLYYQLQEVRA